MAGKKTKDAYVESRTINKGKIFRRKATGNNRKANRNRKRGKQDERIAKTPKALQGRYYCSGQPLPWLGRRYKDSLEISTGRQISAGDRAEGVTCA